ncbi:hypothetical protein TKK_0014676 [Trichogramma kaykai]
MSCTSSKKRIECKSLTTKEKKEIIEAYLIVKKFVLAWLMVRDQGQKLKISILDTMHITLNAWIAIKQSTIANCLTACGFLENRTSRTNRDVTTFNEYVEVNNDIAVMGTLTEEDILNKFTQEDEEEEIQPVRITHYKAKRNIKELRYYLETAEIEDHVFLSIADIDNAVDLARNLKQSKMTDYFASLK